MAQHRSAAAQIVLWARLGETRRSN
ncbi:hypothetical protein HZA86_04190 [Candidatus Uhrbacteria bacterium]|nr:hypothetical protein [Candidatus Uhrbacteria bacterium]